MHLLRVRCPQRSGFRVRIKTPLSTADSTALRGTEPVFAYQTRGASKRPLSCKRTARWPEGLATVATVSLLFVQELTARMRSPSESLVRAFKI